ncbi:MAG: TolC family protein, partial [Campylobacter sp.]|nr:TolC family protein [Campylobacter sp.]
YSIYKHNFDYSYFDNMPMYKALASKFLDENTQNSNEIMLGFSWKIFDFNANSKKAEINRINFIKAKLNLSQKSRENSLKIRSIKNDINSLKARIEALKTATNSAKTSLEEVNQQYNAGLLGYTEFLDALAREYETKSKLSIAKNELEIKKANLIYENGDDIEKRVKR